MGKNENKGGFNKLDKITRTEISRKGGKKIAAEKGKEYMASIGRKGGLASGASRKLNSKNKIAKATKTRGKTFFDE